MTDTPSPAHTQGLLTIDEWGHVVTEQGRPLELAGVALAMGNRHDRREAEANARRLLALWNACSTIPTASLEAGVVEGLIEACRDAVAAVDEAYKATGYIKVAKTSDQRMRLEAAIAQTTGQG